jgi:hypothetical protein
VSSRATASNAPALNQDLPVRKETFGFLLSQARRVLGYRGPPPRIQEHLSSADREHGQRGPPRVASQDFDKKQASGIFDAVCERDSQLYGSPLRPRKLERILLEIGLAARKANDGNKSPPEPPRVHQLWDRKIVWGLKKRIGGFSVG